MQFSTPISHLYTPVETNMDALWMCIGMIVMVKLKSNHNTRKSITNSTPQIEYLALLNLAILLFCCGGIMDVLARAISYQCVDGIT